MQVVTSSSRMISLPSSGAREVIWAITRLESIRHEIDRLWTPSAVQRLTFDTVCLFHFPQYSALSKVLKRANLSLCLMEHGADCMKLYLCVSCLLMCYVLTSANA
eukprot:scaffold42364_cov409-Skeletonema_marinoi.AAC.1